MPGLFPGSLPQPRARSPAQLAQPVFLASPSSLLAARLSLPGFPSSLPGPSSLPAACALARPVLLACGLPSLLARVSCLSLPGFPSRLPADPRLSLPGFPSSLPGSCSLLAACALATAAFLQSPLAAPYAPCSLPRPCAPCSLRQLPGLSMQAPCPPLRSAFLAAVAWPCHASRLPLSMPCPGAIYKAPSLPRNPASNPRGRALLDCAISPMKKPVDNPTWPQYILLTRPRQARNRAA